MRRFIDTNLPSGLFTTFKSSGSSIYRQVWESLAKDFCVKDRPKVRFPNLMIDETV